MTSQHHVSELYAINGTKSQPESGPSWDQVIFKSLTQLHKISSSNSYIRFVTD